MNDLGGLGVLGSAKADNMYHAGWAWAGSTPYRSTKLVAAHFGGTRQPMAVSWPKQIRADATPRPQFHHVIDVVPTIYEATKITPPRVVHGVDQDPIDGTGMSYTFADPKAAGQRRTQFFDIMGSRGIYHDGWFACTFGPRVPWAKGGTDLSKWEPGKDAWELYDLEEDWSQANDLAAANPEKLAQMKSLFLLESARNNNLPIGGGLWSPFINPADLPSTPYTQWTFSGPITRMPEFAAPKLGKFSNTITMDIEVPADANGVLYAIGGFAGGMTCYVKDGVLCYEYNKFMIERTQIKATDKLPTGKVKLEVVSKQSSPTLRGPMEVIIKVNGAVVAQGTVPETVAGAFTANSSFDIGSDQDSPVGVEYFDKGSFPFNGTVGTTTIRYTKS
jgi:arylsulfatase